MVALTLDKLVTFYVEQNRFEEASTLADRAVELGREHLSRRIVRAHEWRPGITKGKPQLTSSPGQIRFGNWLESRSRVKRFCRRQRTHRWFDSLPRSRAKQR